MRIRTLLAAGTVLLVVLAVATGIVLYRAYDARTGAIFAGEIVRTVFELNTLATEYLLQPDDRPLRQWEIRYRSLTDLIAELQESFPEGTQEAQALLRDAELLRSIFLRLSDDEAPVVGFAADPRLDQMWRDRLTADVSRISQSAVATATLLVRSATTAENVAEHRLLAVLLLLLSASAILVLGLWVIFARRVLGRLGLLQIAIKQLETGRFDYRIGMTGGDEFAAVANAFDGMAARLQRMTRELKLSNDDLAQSNRELEQFAYVASHDLKAPLRAIDNLSEWIAEDLGEQLHGEPHRNLQLLQGRVKRMEGLLDDILGYSVAGRADGPIEDLDAAALVSDVVDLIDPPQNVSVVMPSAPARLQTVRAPLEQVFVNLIGNAIKHHDRDQVRIEVTVADKGAAYEFAVGDDGPGIPPEYHGRVFEMFQSLKPRDEVEGSGMGLAIVRKLVESRGGRVTIHSTAGSRGTTIRFTWPKAPLERGTIDPEHGHDNVAATTV